MGDTSIAAVVIGRNEGDRFLRCLVSLHSVVARIVYVDSGSNDGSVAAARDAGAEVVELDTTRPFTAARARSAGFAALEASGYLPDYVQFVDGDCGVQPDWIPAAQAALDRDPRLGIVTGWRSEINRDHSIYNALCDFEWRRPAGEIMTCGGDMMVRSHAFAEVGGFDERVIAAEDDEFCVRIRKADWKIQRLPVEMTLHDAAMSRFGQWWSRAVRSGHGFEQVGDMHPEYFTKERRRVWIYGAILPILALIGLVSSAWIFWTVVALYLLSYLRTVMGLHRDGLVWKEALSHSVFLTLSKFPNFQGILTYKWRQFRGHKMNIIEYK
jgi:GT2 family glycosyltransferase